MMRKLLLGVLFVLSAGCNILHAQNTGTFNGRVVDASGSVVAGATVTATNTATGIARNTATNADGLFTMPALNPGSYDVKAESSGFSPYLKQGVNLLSGATVTVDFDLQIAGSAQKVEVTGEAPLVETTTSEVSAGLQATEVQDLPMLNRTISGMMALLPGVRDPSSAGWGISHNYVAIGGTTAGGSMLVDNLENHDDNDGGTMMSLSLEGVQEFKLLSHDFSSQYGKASTAVILLTTKAGTNQLHGSAFGYGRSDALTRTDYFSDPAHGGIGKPPYSREQYGGSIGGAIVKDRLFYFGSFERVTQQYSQPVPSNIFTQASILHAALPTLDINPQHSVSQPFRDLMINVRTDYQISQHHSLFVRYSSQGNYLVNNSTPVTKIPLLSDPTSTDIKPFHIWNAALGETWVVNASTVNQFTAQFINFRSVDKPTPDCSANWTNCVLSRLSFPSGITTGVYSAFSLNNLEQRAEFKDDFSHQFGKHAFKTGVDYAFMPVLGGLAYATVPPGTITFFDDPSVIVSNTVKYPQGFSTPGAVRQISLAPHTPANFGSTGAWEFGAYVQDDFKVKPRFTLNLGVRYDVYYYMNQNTTLAQNRTYLALKAIGSPFGQLPQTDKTDVAPRFGFAWDITGDSKNVIRGGYGIFYTQASEDQFAGANWQEGPNILFTTTYGPDPSVGCTPNPATGACPLGNFVFGTTPLPADPGIAPTNFPAGQSVGGSWISPTFKDNYTQQTHVGYSRSLTDQDVLSVDYTHMLSIHNWDSGNINPICTTTFITPCAAPGGPVVPVGQRLLSPITKAALGDPNFFGSVGILMSDGRSFYDEMLVHYEHRAARMTLQVNYVLSNSRGWAGNAGNGQSDEGQNTPEIPNAYGGCRFCAGEFGPGTFDERHRVTVTGVIQLPLGLQLAPTMTFATGRPYQIFRAQGPNSNLRCFVNNCTDPNGTQEVGVNAARGSDLFVLSNRVTKTFALGEKKKIDAFVELFNITDRANFGGNYGTLATAPSTFEQPISFVAGTGASAGSTIPNSFQMQLGARFSF